MRFGSDNFTVSPIGQRITAGILVICNIPANSFKENLLRTIFVTVVISSKSKILCTNAHTVIHYGVYWVTGYLAIWLYLSRKNQ
jgi:hypothetical protein